MELFRTQKLNDHLYRIFDITDVQMYLAVGSHTAVLIDTGCGFGALTETVRQLTAKPVVVLLTHGHVDHAMGAAAFDVVYMNRMDIPVFMEHSRSEMRVGYLRQSPRFEPAALKLMMPPIMADRFLPVGNDTVFDLGGLHVRMFACPGHTPGSMVALLEEDRVLITGDACNPFTYLFLPECQSVSAYRASLACLEKQVSGRFDSVFFSHGVTDGQVSILSDALSLCDQILAGGAEGDQEWTFVDSRGIIAKPVDENLLRRDGVLMNIVYNPLRL